MLIKLILTRFTSPTPQQFTILSGAKRNQKVFKFVRKDYQISDDVHPKNDRQQHQNRPLPRENKELSKEEQKFRKELDFLQFKEPGVDQSIRQQEVHKQKRKELIEPNDHKKREKSKEPIQSIEFDKKLTKVVMPDRLEKGDLAKKIQNKVLTCFEKKKPHVSVKDLIKADRMAQILGRKQRKFNTKETFNEQLNNIASSLRKVDLKKKESKNKRQEEMIVRENINQIPFGNNLMDNDNDFENTDQDSIFDEILPHDFDLNFYSEDLIYNEGPIQNAELEFTHPQRQQPFFRRKPQINNIFASEQKPSKQKREKDLFDLRNLKVPKLTQIQERKQKWREPVQPIQQMNQEDNNFIFYGGNQSEKTTSSTYLGHNSSFQRYRRREYTNDSWQY